MADKEGFLFKLGKKRFVKSYKRRYFVQRGSQLLYFEDPSQTKCLGVISLGEVQSIRLGDPSKHTKKAVAPFASFVVELVTPQRTWVLFPDSREEQESWVQAWADEVPEGTVQPALLRSRRSRNRRARRKSPPPPPPPIEPDSDDDSREEDGGGKEDVAEPPAPAAAAPATNGGRFGMFGREKGGKNGRSGRRDSEWKREHEAEVRTLRGELQAIRGELHTIQTNPPSGGEGGGGKKDKKKRNKKWGGRSTPLLIDDSDSDADEHGTRGWRKHGEGNKRSRLRTSEGEEEDDEEARTCCKCCGTWNFKVLFIVSTNALIFAFGLALIVVAGYALRYKSSFEVLLPVEGMYILLGVGCGLLVVAVVGSFAATRHTKLKGKCLLTVYFILLAVLMLGQIVAAALLFMKSHQLNNFDPSKTHTQGVNNEIDTFLNKTCYDCCGLNNWHPHHGNHSGNHSDKDAPARRLRGALLWPVAPEEDSSNPACKWLSDVTKEACPDPDGPTAPSCNDFENKLLTLVDKKIVPIAGGTVGVVVVQLLALVAVWYLVIGRCCRCGKSKKDKKKSKRGRRGNIQSDSDSSD